MSKWISKTLKICAMDFEHIIEAVQAPQAMKIVQDYLKEPFY
jgi:hypothetical protein